MGVSGKHLLVLACLVFFSESVLSLEVNGIVFPNGLTAEPGQEIQGYFPGYVTQTSHPMNNFFECYTYAYPGDKLISFDWNNLMIWSAKIQPVLISSNYSQHTCQWSYPGADFSISKNQTKGGAVQLDYKLNGVSKASIGVYFKTKPVTLHDYAGLWRNAPFYINFFPSSESTIIKFTSFNYVGSNYYGTSAFINVDGNNELAFYSFDNDNVSEEPKRIFVALDSNAPLIDFNSLSEWQKQAFDFNFNVSDSLSGLKEVKYRIDGNEWLVFTGNASIQISTDGNHLIEFKAVDFAGNESNASTFLALDRIAPRISVNLAEGQDINSFGYSLNGSFFDGHSGVKSLRVFVDGNEFNSAMPDGIWLSDINFSGNGLHEIIIKALDFAGNEIIIDFNISVSIAETIVEASSPENQDTNLQNNNSATIQETVLENSLNEAEQESQSTVQNIQPINSLSSQPTNSFGSASGSIGNSSGGYSSNVSIKAQNIEAFEEPETSGEFALPGDDTSSGDLLSDLNALLEGDEEKAVEESNELFVEQDEVIKEKNNATGFLALNAWNFSKGVNELVNVGRLFSFVSNPVLFLVSLIWALVV